ncbi:YbaL family putative K(+) efflux transporter [Rhodanobacter sp. MP7CTX1]|uniref:YbaL family putative K(+) efflux transporter n=1 Tax=Rhodanobacter sp. MP7CTX1 TaxID=2723084 RepID=UPI00160C33C9|nr:YbaL family putative K(+) efflux transporter [Rhodanobacter sp. MP7CTX1]MBB6186291.1 CPA2 family monovalent cation:H+ antiporter-2 [Rhodanobacter sp. MP7CTX1]
MHDAPLIATLVSGIVLAFVFASIAYKLRLPPLAGYLMAGVVVGPFTPGYVADGHLAHELAEVGVVLLMFGVGLHFSLKDLLSVKGIAIPGALGQMAVATVLGMLLGWGLGWPMAQSFVFGLALSVASTVVLLRAMEERRLMETERGRIAVGWLIVEDLAMVLALVLLPAIGLALSSGGQNGSSLSFAAIAGTVGITIGKVALFVALMLIVGKRLIPWILKVVAHTGSRELFRLAVLAIALGVAFGVAGLFGVSFELGAFFAGMMMGESKLAQRATEETLPLRDAFAVLFFVSIGMLFNYHVVLTEPLVVLAALSIIVIGKSLAAFAIVLAFGRPLRTALTIATSLAQIGEFSFILIGVGVAQNLVSKGAQDVLLAAAILSILLNPLLFKLLDRARPWLDAREALQQEQALAPALVEPAADMATSTLTGHVVVAGYGRVGRLVGESLHERGDAVLVLEEEKEKIEMLREHGIEAIVGNAAQDDVLEAANLAHARALVVTVPDAFESGEVVRLARLANPKLQIIARADSDAGMAHLLQKGADLVVLAEPELARGMLEHLLARESGSVPRIH